MLAHFALALRRHGASAALAALLFGAAAPALGFYTGLFWKTADLPAPSWSWNPGQGRFPGVSPLDTARKQCDFVARTNGLTYTVELGQMVAGTQQPYVCRWSDGSVTANIYAEAKCPLGFEGRETPTPRCVSNGQTILDLTIGKPCCRVGNPIDPVSGNKYQEETDYVGNGVYPFVLKRTYNSRQTRGGSNWGVVSWQGRYDAYLELWESGDVKTALASRPDGRSTYFTFDGTRWAPDANITDRLDELKDAGGVRIGWRYFDAATDETEAYDAAGKLLSVTSRAGLTHTLAYSDGTAVPPGGGVIEGTTTPLPAGLLIRVVDHFGRALSFGWDSARRIVRVTDPSGSDLRFTYDTVGRLASVIYQDSTVRAYRYNEPANTGGFNLPSTLTGIIDENGARFATFKYDLSLRGVSSERGDGAGKVTVSYSGTTGFTTDALGTPRTYAGRSILGIVKNTSISQPAGAGSPASSTGMSYDATGNVASRTDYNGNRTDYTYDLARNLESSRTEGLTSAGGQTPQTRTISTQWHPTFRLPTGIAEPLRITTNVYDEAGNLLSRTVQPTADASGAQGFSAAPVGAPRVWTYTYNANGQVLTVDGPRTDVSDVTTYTYHANDDPDLGKRGNLATVTNAAGHTTSITAYNGHSQPLTIVDPNGLTTTLTYDARLRLKSRSVGGELTSYDYDNAGQLTKVTLPDGSFLSYGYDAAHRLTGIQDNQGNRIAYTLDLEGNRTKEEVFDPAIALAQTRSRVFDALSRLATELGAQNQATNYAYDANGNLRTVTDPLTRVTSNEYDPLNRLKQVTDPALGVTQYAYNGLDTLTSVTDPRSLVTGYTVAGLGNLTQQSSPDTGNTANTYDAAGNLLTQTDAKGQVTTYAYDALNRVTLITFHDGSRQTYAYDQGANSLGRLSSITETNAASQVTSTIAYAYDPRGRVTSETRTVNGVQHLTGYSYDAAGRLSGVTYPSGRTVTYGFDSLGRVAAVNTTKEGVMQAVVSNVAYHPFGGVKSYTLGNGQSYSRSYDQDGRIASYTLGATQYAIGYDAASRIEFINDVGNPANTNTYGYDNLDRLTSAVLPGTPFAYGYDAVGNRLSKTVGNATETLAYSPTSNRIASLTPATGPVRSFVFDANGSTTADGVNAYAYDARGRMTQAVSVIGTTSYQVNALGQRIRKTNTQTDTVFHYDTQGRLIAESDPGGALRREMLYLGDIPVGVVQ